MSTEEKLPYIEEANKLKADAKAAVVVNPTPEPSPVVPVVVSKDDNTEEADLSQFDRNDELVGIMLNGINNDGSVDPNAQPVAKTSEEVAQDGNDDVLIVSAEMVSEEEGEELEVEPHTLADGTEVLKSDDNEIYDKDSFELLGTWNAETNSLA